VFDEYLMAAAATPEIEQIVIAPAGMDSRAYRLGWPRELPVFEVDKPAVLAVKEEVLRGRPARTDRRPVAADMVTGHLDRRVAGGRVRPPPTVGLAAGRAGR